MSQSKRSWKSSSFQWGSLQLPESYRVLLHPELLTHPVPSVPRVDCQNCRQVEQGIATWQTRCCDVTPRFSNFVVGEILEAGGHPVLEGWIEERRGDPFFLQVPPRLARKHKEARKDGRYGLPCSLLDEGGGTCSLYSRRPALCVGYHCYYPDLLWKEMGACLTSTLRLLEENAARFFVATSSLSLQKMADVWNDFSTEEEIWEGESQVPLAYEAFWQEWKGREDMFYRACFHRLREGGEALRRELEMYRWETLSFTRKGRALGSWQTLIPVAPPSSIRRLYRTQSAVEPEDNEWTCLEQQQHLLWYLEEIKKPTLWEKMRAWLVKPTQEQDERSMDKNATESEEEILSSFTKKG